MPALALSAIIMLSAMTLRQKQDLPRFPIGWIAGACLAALAVAVNIDRWSVSWTVASLATLAVAAVTGRYVFARRS